MGQGLNAFKFGWARVNFNYFISPEELEFICDAILQIAEHGWKLLPLYQANWQSALFVHRQKDLQLNRPSLAGFQLLPKQEPWAVQKNKVESPGFQEVLEDAKRIYSSVETFLRSLDQNEIGSILEPSHNDDISQDDVWWVTAKDVMDSFKAEHRGSASRSSFKAAKSLRKDAWSTALQC